MNALVSPQASQLPKHLQAVFGPVTTEVAKEFSGGIQSGFPVLSIRGKVWRVKKGGEEAPLLNEREEAVQSIDVVLVQSSERLSKIHYDKKFSEGDNQPPRCWSGNGVKPDVAVQNPIAKACGSCPNNVWGSRISEEGKKSRACSDNRRMAVVSLDDLDRVVGGEVDAVSPMLLRVPPASLNPLKDFVEKALLPKGIPPYAVYVRIGFDVTASSPKLTFKPCKHPVSGSPFLSEEHAEIIKALRGSEDIKRILDAELEEYSAAGTTDVGGEAAQAAAGGASPVAAAAEASTAAPAASSKKAKPKLRPAAEEEAAAAAAETVDEEVEEDILAGAASNTKMEKRAAPAPAATEEEEDILATPPPAAAKPKGKAKPAAAAAAPAKPAATKPAAPAPAGDENFDDMLASILSS